ncbi:MAG: hypothetical protein PHD66_07410 [Eubacteriales bacterium]|nr:hypothetical protein [Eubacteriales bacterium]
MDTCSIGLVTAIGAAAAVIAKDLSSDEIAFLSAVLTQLGDTLATIAARRDCKEKSNNAVTVKSNEKVV